MTMSEAIEPEACYQALKARDARFDGRVFIAVVTTGIYCRPVCPVPAAHFENCRFFRCAAEAQTAGFRPCLRCRPEIAPERGMWPTTANTVRRGLGLIAEGALDDASVDDLAERLGVGERQLRRLFQEHLGASPIAVAQTRRVLLAKQLIVDTRLPMTEVAFAAGFGSVRRFNETFRKLYQRPPSALRRTTAPTLPEGSVAAAGVTVRLRYRPPYDWRAMLDHLRARAIDGVEHFDGDVYRRIVAHGEQIGSVAVAHVPAQHSLAVTIRFPCVRAVPSLVTRVRRVFDLAADVTAIGSHLARDPRLAPLVAARPGLRVPGGWDDFETGARAVLGQQVSVKAAQKLGCTLARLFGTAVRGHAPLDRAFPSARQVARANLTSLGMPNARRQTLVALARAAIANPALFEPQSTLDATVAQLRAVAGIGEWTAQYVALRAGREPDAFPATDVALLRAFSSTRASELAAHAERWRPFRAYAAQHLWAAAAEQHHV